MNPGMSATDKKPSPSITSKRDTLRCSSNKLLSIYYILEQIINAPLDYYVGSEDRSYTALIVCLFGCCTERVPYMKMYVRNSQDRQLCSMIMHIKGIAAAADLGRTNSAVRMLTLLRRLPIATTTNHGYLAISIHTSLQAPNTCSS